ncbi:SRPBCC family protein [Frigidibacter sp. MR17.24]|uniref:SRPBCC family protein n=1 Tax=Frigidibacter sp. MR17.24 TaxID=3127345 RepID=UPI003012E503
MTDTPPVLKISRPMPATAARVFAAWTTAEDLRGWFAPFPFTAPEAVVEPKVGGRFEVCMAGPDGSRMWTRGTITALEPDAAISLDLGAHGPDGTRLFGAATEARITAQPMGCLLSVTQSYTPGPACPPGVFAGAEMGWTAALMQLATLVMRG